MALITLTRLTQLPGSLEVRAFWGSQQVERLKFSPNAALWTLTKLQLTQTTFMSNFYKGDILEKIKIKVVWFILKKVKKIFKKVLNFKKEVFSVTFFSLIFFVVAVVTAPCRSKWPTKNMILTINALLVQIINILSDLESKQPRWTPIQTNIQTKWPPNQTDKLTEFKSKTFYASHTASSLLKSWWKLDVE